MPKTTKPWADQPFPLMPVPGAPGAATCNDPNILALAAEMANAHNTILRGLNAIYLQCPHVHEEQDIADFALYVKTWGDAVHHHHETEEKFFFPEIERIVKAEGATESVMATNEQQHHSFEAKVAALTEYAQDVLQGKKKYDSKELKDIIDQFAPFLTGHLHDEIDTLFQLEKYKGTASMKKAMERTGQEAAKNADVHLVLPFAFGCIDKTMPGGENFPPIPFFVSWLNWLVFSRRHKGAWRFNPSDHWGKPRELQFLGEGD